MISAVDPLRGFIAFVVVVFLVWTVIDATSRPRKAWAAAGRSKTAWVVSLILGSIAGVGIGGVIVAIAYVVWVRPQVRRGEASHPTAPLAHQTPLGAGAPPAAWVVH